MSVNKARKITNKSTIRIKTLGNAVVAKPVETEEMVVEVVVVGDNAAISQNIVGHTGRALIRVAIAETELMVTLKPRPLQTKTTARQEIVSPDNWGRSM